MHTTLKRVAVAIAALTSFALASCSGTSSFGTPQSGPVNPAPINNPAVTPAPQAQGARAVADAQSVDTVVKWYFTRGASLPADDKFKKRLELRQKYDEAHATLATAAAATREATLQLAGALPKDAPDAAVYALSVETFGGDDGEPERLAQQNGVQRQHQVVDPKNPDAPPQDVIKIAKGPATWTIDRLTGLVTFEKQHNDGVLPVDVKQAQTAAETFVRDHGGLPEDAVLGDPIFELSKGDSLGAPKPERITFVWRHKDKTVFGDDAVAADVTMDATAGGGLPGAAPGQVGAPPAAAPAQGAPPATAAAVAAAPPQTWGVTRMTRLWRTRGKELDKATGLLTAQAAVDKLKTAAIPGADPSKPLAVSDVTFGEFRDPGTVAQGATRPAWGMTVNGKHVDVDAKTGSVLLRAPVAAATPSPAPKGRGKGGVSEASAAPASSAPAAAAATGASPASESSASAASPAATGSASAAGASSAATASPSASASPKS